jgi:hypothetical protein
VWPYLQTRRVCCFLRSNPVIYLSMLHNSPLYLMKDPFPESEKVIPRLNILAFLRLDFPSFLFSSNFYTLILSAFLNFPMRLQVTEAMRIKVSTKCCLATIESYLLQGGTQAILYDYALNMKHYYFCGWSASGRQMEPIIVTNYYSISASRCEA